MKRAVLVVGTVLFALIAAVAIAGFIRFNFTDGGDMLQPNPSNPSTPVGINVDTSTGVTSAS
jgi:hypothetical protein